MLLPNRDSGKSQTDVFTVWHVYDQWKTSDVADLHGKSRPSNSTRRKESGKGATHATRAQQSEITPELPLASSRQMNATQRVMTRITSQLRASAPSFVPSAVSGARNLDENRSMPSFVREEGCEMVDPNHRIDNTTDRTEQGVDFVHRTLTAPRHVSLQGKWDAILPETKGKSKGKGRKGRGKLTDRETVTAQSEDLSTAEINRVSTPLKPMNFVFGHLLHNEREK